MFGPKSPSYTIGHAPRQQQSPKNSPGPAAYFIHAEKPKGLSFTRSPRASLNTSMIPGPGEYNHSSSIGKGPKPIIISRKLRRSTESVPGPSDYSPRIQDKTVKYTFRKQKDIDQPNINPGPGAYSPKYTAIKSPITLIGKAKRSQSNFNMSPGPAHYNIATSAPLNAFVFSKARKENSPINKYPGPADYSPKLENSEKSAIIIPRRPDPSLSMSSPKSSSKLLGKFFNHVNYSASTEMSSPDKGELPSNKRNRLRSKGGKSSSLNPGPGDYDPKSIGKKNPSAIFGTSRRYFKKCEKNPGPGDYETARSHDRRGFTFTREKKIKNYIAEGRGPGKYDIPNTIGSVI